jgi:hypothetical protein
MPALPKVLAIIDGGVVVNVAALSTENDYSQLKADLAAQHDSVLEVASAGIGWEEYKPGKLRMPAPSPDCVWKDKTQEWDCPAPPEPVEP